MSYNAIDKYRETITKKKNELENRTYSQKALEALAKGNYASMRNNSKQTKQVPYLKPTQTKQEAPVNNTTQAKPSTRYNNQNVTKETKSTRDTRFDKDFDNFYNYREGDFSGEVDYDPKTDTDVEKWRNVKKDIMKKNNWTDKEFDERYKAYSDERYKKQAKTDAEINAKFASEHPVLGTVMQAAQNPGVWIEGASNMITSLLPEKYKAQSADDPRFYNTMQKTAMKQAVKDNNIKTGFGKTVYDIATGLGDMVLASGVPVLGAATLGTEAASRNQMQALERGVDPNKAALTGAASGVISGVMNKVGLDKALGSTGKTALGTVGKAAVKEGAENVLEDLANLAVDSGLNVDKSQLSAMHKYYTSQGLNDDEAWSQVMKDTGLDLVTSFGSGALFGGVMSGARNLPALVSDVKSLGKYASMDNRGSVDPKALAEEARLNVKSPAKVEGEKLPEVESPDKALTPQEVQILQESLKANDYITELRDTFANAEPIDKARMLVDGGYYKDMIEAGKAFKAGKLDDAVSDYLTKMESNGNPAPTKNQVTVNDYDKAELNNKYNGDYEQMRRGMIKEYTGADDAKADDYYKALSTFVTGEGSKADTKVLDDYVDNAPTYNGQISRGMHFEVGDPEYDNFMRQVHENGTITLGKPSSWASDPAVSRLYSHMGDNTYDSIEIVCNQNRTSTPINFVNMQGENEILSSSKASWTVLKDDTVTMPNGARKTILYVAETGDKTPPKNAVTIPDEVDPNNVIYHAGTLSRLNKADTAGKMEGTRDTGYYGTGHYFVDQAHKSSIGEGSSYKDKPYSSVDISKYDNLYKADTDAKANKLHDFSQKMMRYVNGYNDRYYTSDGEIDPLARDNYVTDLYGQYLELFPDNHMSLGDFENRLNDMRSNYEYNYYDRGDSAFTTFMKEHGYNGVDTRGTRSANTERGIVIYDLDEDSVLQSNVKDADIKNGLMNTRVRNENPVFDTATDERIQSDIDSYNSRKRIADEYKKLFDDKAHKKLWNDINETKQRISDLEVEGVDHYKSLIEDDAYLEKAAILRQKDFARMGLEEDIDVLKEDMRNYARENLDETIAMVEQEKTRLAEMQQKYDADEELSKQAYQKAKENIEKAENSRGLDAQRKSRRYKAKHSDPEGKVYLSDDYIEDYYHSGNRGNINRKDAADAGKSIIIRDRNELSNFLFGDNSNYGETAAYGKVSNTLADKIYNKNNDVRTHNYFLEVEKGHDIHAKKHMDPKEPGDMPISNDELLDALENINDADVVDVKKGKNGYKIKLKLDVTDGRIVIVEMASKSTGALKLTSGWKNIPNKPLWSGKSSAGGNSHSNSARLHSAPNTNVPQNSGDVNSNPQPNRRSFFDDLPRTDETGISKVGTNTMVNSNVYTKEQIDSDPVISELNKYAKANNDVTFNQAKEDIVNDGATLLDDYINGKRSINTDLDVDRAMILLTDMANKIDAGDTSLEAQRNLLFSKLRQAGTRYGQTIQAFKKWNNTAEGAIANGESILHEPVSRWKSQNKKTAEINGRIAKALEQMGVDSSMRNKTTTEKTHEQVKQGVKNVLAKEFGSIDNYFNDNDIEVLANWAENKVPVWQITDEIEHKLSTGEWYTIDESTQPKYPINQKLKNALDDLVAQEPAVKEPPTLDEIRNEVRTTLDKEMARTGEFTDDDVNYIANLIQNGATKQELSEALNTKMATGKFGISPETQQQVTDLFTYANRFDPNSKQAFDLKSAAYKLIADEAVSEDATPFEKFESWRYLAMLGNPKTMVRNWIGNNLFGAVTGVSNNLATAFEAGVDKASRAMGGNGIQRTKAFLNPVEDRALIKAAGEDGEAHRYTTLNGTKYEKGTKDAIRKQKSVFNSKLLRLYEAATDRGVSDYSAVKRKYSTSLAGYMKANGLDESAFDANDRYTALKDKARTQVLTDAEKAEMNSLKSTVDTLEKARDYAVKQAEYATFHEDNAFAKWLTKTSNSAPGPLRAVIEGLIPFKKTPANILRSGVEYSPLGAIKSIKETGKLIYENTGSRKANLEDTYTKKSKLTGKTKEVNKSLAADVLDSWSKTLTGTALVGLGYYLKNKGILNSSNKDEKWQDDLEGIQNYSITINGKTYTLDWAAPAVMPLLMGAEMSKIKDRNGMLDQDWYENLDEIIGTANALLDPIFETSMLQGIKNTMESAANDIKYDENGAIGGLLGSMAFNTGLGYLTQGVPTIAGQVARTIDNTRRTSDTKADQSFMGSVEKQGRKMMNKIPGLSMLNTPYYDSYGRTQNNSPWNDPIRNFLYQSLSPAYIRDINTTDADRAAREAYYGLGEPNEEGKQLPIMDSKVFPTWKSKVTASGKKLSPEEMATYRKESGEAQYAIRDALTKEDWYNNLDASKQTEILKKVNTLVDKIGKDSVDKLDSGSKDLEAYQSGGVEGLLNKWGGDAGASKAKEITGLSGNTNAIKEINQAYADGDTKKGDELTEKYAKYNKERERLNEKYGLNIKMSDFTKREDANPGSNETWAKEHSNKTTNTTKTTSNTTVPKVTIKSSTDTSTTVDTTGYEKQVERAGSQKTKFTNDLPKLKELGYGKSEMYTYAYAINQDSSLTPQSFNTQFKKMDLDGNGSMKQDEMISYFNKNNTSEQQANYLWKTYGENKGTSWKTLPVLKNGTWKKSK